MTASSEISRMQLRLRKGFSLFGGEVMSASGWLSLISLIAFAAFRR